MSFTNIPILDLSLARSVETKPIFLDQLRHALLEVGFLYLKNIGIAQELIDNVVEEGVKFFDIPLEEKYILVIFSSRHEHPLPRPHQTIPPTQTPNPLTH
ncbi:hypothetical protein EYC84_004767 [Monilinia fructicola]|uniref:Non-haem dioxygenase N-terminal domain-containing protein n=1 Tax=Monilinia fructicola TaxID=38448 RepID=A0A5M9K1G6_MONFR|nr:hypothetical protein EYC84_004767 [Monilinia fructicola]